MLKKIISLYFLSISLCIFSQSKWHDSLKKVITHLPNDSVTKLVNLNLLITNYIEGSRLDSAKKYANLLGGLDIKNKRNKIRAEAISYTKIGEIYGKQSNHAEQINYLSKALKLMDGSTDLEGIMRINSKLADAFVSNNDTMNAMFYIQKTKFYLSQFSTDTIRTRDISAKIDRIIGEIYLIKKDGKNALLCFNLAYKKLSKIKPNPWIEARLFEDFAVAYTLNNDQIKAKDYYQKAINMYLSVGARLGIIHCKESLAKIFLLENQGDSALAILKKAENNAIKIKSSRALLDAYEGLFSYYIRTKYDKETIKYLQLHSKLKDSINKAAYNKELALAKIKLKNYEIDLENKLLAEKNKTLEVEVINRRNIIFLIITVALVFLFALLYNNGRIKLKAQKQQILLENKLLRNQMNPHFIFNSLSSIQSYVLSEDSLMAAKYLSIFSRLMRYNLDNSRSDLIPIEDEIHTLKLYLEMENLRMNHTFNYTFQYNENEIGGMVIPTMLIQPFIENSIKHGIKQLENNKIGEITVKLVVLNKKLICSIIDNGIGMSASKKEKNKKSKKPSFGMQATKNRLKILCKEMKSNYYFNVFDKNELNSNETGTNITFNLPYKLK